MRISSYNLENLFTRPIAMSDDTPGGGQAISDHEEANNIVAGATYSEQDKDRLLQLSEKYGWHRLNQPANSLVFLQKIRGQLFRVPQDGPVSVVAEGRSDWTGWFELRRENVEWQATLNTGKVIAEVNPDILLVVEVENRPTLKRFNEQVLRLLGLEYPHVQVIDGNDSRGIDVGILSRFPILEMRSHVDEEFNDRPLFSRDCPEYDIQLPDGQRLVVIPNHFKSKRGGNSDTSQQQRRRQAQRAHEIGLAALQRSPLVLIGGDLNDTPGPNLNVLFEDGFADINVHPNYPTDRPGTFATGTASNKIDYLIMSEGLRAHVTDVGIERRGTFHPDLWQSLPGVTRNTEASDHHLIWADFEL